jgi:CHAD domain-containing protein
MTTTRIEKWIQGVSPEDRTSDVAKRTLAARLGAVLEYLPLAAEKADENVEFVHDLRVCTRRAAAALRLYSDLLPHCEVGWIRKQLRRIRRATNDARDYDVLAQRLAKERSDPQAQRLLVTVHDQRCQAQQPILALYKSLKHDSRFARRVAKLLRHVRPPCKRRGEAKDPRFAKWAKANLRPLVKAFFKAAPTDGTDMAALHAFRIRGKELRYSMELLAAAFPLRFREKLYPIIETLQDKLGEINDLVAAQMRLQQRIRMADDVAQADRLKRLLAQENARLERSRRAFFQWFTPQFRVDLCAQFKEIFGGLQEPTRAAAIESLPPPPSKRLLQACSPEVGMLC